MSVILKLVKRNSLNYLYDKTAIFFSFLSVLIIIFLYVAFLGDMQVQEMTRNVGDISGIRWLIDSWILAGIITANSVTVPLSILSDMIQDIEHKIIDDFLTAPISRGKVVFGYLASSWVIGIVLSIVTFLVAQIYVLSTGGEIVSFITFVKAILLIILSVITFSSMSFFLLTFVKSVNTVGVINTIVGTLIGFLAGIYIPIGVFGGTIKYIIKLNPAAHMTAIFRQVFMEEPLELVFNGAPESILNEYRTFYGIDLYIFDTYISVPMMILYLLSISIIFFGLSVLRLNKLKR